MLGYIIHLFICSLYFNCFFELKQRTEDTEIGWTGKVYKKKTPTIALTLTRRRWYMKSSWTFERCTCVPKMNFLGQRFCKLPCCMIQTTTDMYCTQCKWPIFNKLDYAGGKKTTVGQRWVHDCQTDNTITVGITSIKCFRFIRWDAYSISQCISPCCRLCCHFSTQCSLRFVVILFSPYTVAGECWLISTLKWLHQQAVSVDMATHWMWHFPRRPTLFSLVIFPHPFTVRGGEIDRGPILRIRLPSLLPPTISLSISWCCLAKLCMVFLVLLFLTCFLWWLFSKVQTSSRFPCDVAKERNYYYCLLLTQY